MLRSHWLGLLLISVCVLSGLPRVAQADEMDLTLSDLDDYEADPRTGGDRRWAWRALMSQLGASMAPPVLEPARTVGPGGFYVGFESWVTGIEDDSLYWAYGTEGDNPDEGVFNRFADPVYTWLRFNVRKGLPFGFELGASAGHAMHTDYWTWGASLKFALFEGFREEALGYLPDVAIRASVQTLTGASEFNLTIPSIDLILSKPIVVARLAKLTPFVAGQVQWILGDSEVVDLTPGVNAFDACRPFPPEQSQELNRNNPGAADRSTFVCQDDPTDFDNNTVFPEVRALRAKLVFGLQYQYEALTLSGSFAFDVLKPGDTEEELNEPRPITEPGVAADGDLLPRQWTVNLGVGFTY